MKLNFPKHWGDKPVLQTCDYRQLPKPYEKYFGSTSLVVWILQNQRKDNYDSKISPKSI